VRVGDGTGEVSSDRRPTAAVTAGISRNATSRGRSGEKSEEAIVLEIIETTQLDGREGPLRQRRLARREVMVQARQGPTTPIDSSRQLQRRLSLAAKRSRNRRFHARYDRICRPDMRWRAWQEVRVNGGAAGVDGVTIEMVERHGAEPFVEQSRQDLRAGTYRPQPVLRVYLPKPDGGPRP
jgi:hypothetical protein